MKKARGEVATVRRRSPGSAARRGTLDEFLSSVEENPHIDWKEFLFSALHNKDLTARVEIVNWMLDHGADPAQVDVDERLNALHVMFEEREHDFVGEARLLQRFLDGGADVNLKAPKWSVPIQAMLENYKLTDDVSTPFYDVIFSYPGIDWEVIVRKAFGEPASLERSVELAAKRRPELYRRMRNYMENGPSPRPVFD